MYTSPISNTRLGTTIVSAIRFILLIFKQKTAYEITVDWSSDVCSSDLFVEQRGIGDIERREVDDHLLEIDERFHAALRNLRLIRRVSRVPARILEDIPLDHRRNNGRSEERRVGKECRSRWSPYQLKKKA